MDNELSERLRTIRARIEKAAMSANRDPGEVRLLAVSKTHPATAIGALRELGVKAFGENKVQEAEAKIRQLGSRPLEWHLIGHLQSNKARKAVQLFDVIQSIDSVEIAERLERICKEEGRRELRIFIEVDLAGEASKNGVSEQLLPDLAAYLQGCECLRLIGLMVLPPYFDDPESARSYFRRLRSIRDGLRADGVFGAASGELSMGMSHDFEVAVQEGSTMVRVGTALFGQRQPAPAGN